MKKKMCLTVLCTVMCCAVFGATLQRTILSHKGKLTQYDADLWQNAITDAVAGDTVFFTPGDFSGSVTIDKVITLIGAGVSEGSAFFKGASLESDYSGCATDNGTTIRGSITLSIEGSPVLTTTFMEGINVQDGDFVITNSLTNLKIRRCQVRKESPTYYGGGSFYASSAIYNLELEDCYVHTIDCSNMSNYDIHNCYIENVNNMSRDNEITNSVIVWVNEVTKSCNFTNCVIQHWADYNTYINCVLGGEASVNSSYVNCHFVGYGVPQDNSKAQFNENGWLGTDNKIIGLFSGPAPFTLIPSQPYVSSSTLTYTKSTKKLNVNVTVKQGK